MVELAEKGLMIMPDLRSVKDVMREAVSSPAYQADNFIYRILRSLHNEGRVSKRHGYGLWHLYQMHYPVEGLLVDMSYPAMSETEVCDTLEMMGFTWVDDETAPRWDKRG